MTLRERLEQAVRDLDSVTSDRVDDVLEWRRGGSVFAAASEDVTAAATLQ